MKDGIEQENIEGNRFVSGFRNWTDKVIYEGKF